MKKLEISQMEILQGGKFFGTTTEYGSCNPIGDTGRGMMYVTETFYAFWLPISETGQWKECAV